MNKTVILGLLFIGAILLTANSPAYTQRKGKKKETQPSPTQVKQEVEYMFIEAEKLYILKNYSQATELLNRCLQLDPQNDVVFYKLADINNNTEQFTVAADFINNALAINNSNKYYYLLAIDIYSNLGNLKRVAENYEELIKVVPNTDNYLFNLAAVYIYLKDYDKAIATYNQAETKFGLSEEISFQRQKVYLEQNKLEDAIEEGKKLIEAFPDNPRYVLMTAEILASNNRLDEASTLINELLAKQPDVSAARLQLATIYWKQNNLDGFEKELNTAFQDPALNINAKINFLMKYMVYLPNTRLEKILPDLTTILTEAHPDNSNAYLMAGDVFTTLIDKNLIPAAEAESAKKKAALYYSKYVALDQSNYSVWQNLLNLDLQLDMQDSLAVHAELALEVFPNQAWLYLVNGISKQNQGNLNAAVQLLEMGATRSSSNRGLQLIIYSYLGDLYNELKDYAKSDKAYDKVLELDPLNFTVLNNYSYYLSLRGEKLDQAKKMCSTLIKSNPDNTTFLDTYAWVHYNIGEYEEAKRVFEKIIEIGVEEGVYYDHFGDTLYKLGFTQEAIIQWKKAKELDDSIENIDEKINQGKIIQ